MATLTSSDHPEAKALALDLTHDFEKKPDETLGSIIAHVDNFLAAFLNPWTSEVFCAESPTFSFDQLDDVKLLCISIPATSAPNSAYWFPTTRLCEEILFSLYWPLSPAAPTVFGGACVAICILISWLLVNTALRYGAVTRGSRRSKKGRSLTPHSQGSSVQNGVPQDGPQLPEMLPARRVET